MSRCPAQIWNPYMWVHYRCSCSVHERDGTFCAHHSPTMKAERKARRDRRKAAVEGRNERRVQPIARPNGTPWLDYSEVAMLHTWFTLYPDVFGE